MTILVSGGAGFAHGNFVPDWIELQEETVVNLDKLTYAGNLDTLKELKDGDRHVIVHGDIGDDLAPLKVSVRQMHSCVYEAQFRTCGLAHLP